MQSFTYNFVGFIVYEFSLSEELLKIVDFAIGLRVGWDCNTYKSSCEEHMLKFKSLLYQGVSRVARWYANQQVTRRPLWQLNFCVPLYTFSPTLYIFSLPMKLQEFFYR